MELLDSCLLRKEQLKCQVLVENRVLAVAVQVMVSALCATTIALAAQILLCRMVMEELPAAQIAMGGVMMQDRNAHPAVALGSNPDSRGELVTMDELQKAADYLRARQEAEIADRALQAAKAKYSPVLGALFPEQRHQAEVASWEVMDLRDDAQRRAGNLGGQLPPETKQIADEVFDQWKREKR